MSSDSKFFMTQNSQKWYNSVSPFKWISHCLNDGLRGNPESDIEPEDEVLETLESEDAGSSLAKEIIEGDAEFSSTLGILLSCVGSVVGSGNIWRYPRVAAQNSHSEGCLAFIIVWIVSLFLWSIPIIIIEYSIGRFTRSGPLVAFRKFVGTKMIWLGGWVVMTTFFISGYYSVIVGWCFYYFYYTCSLSSLPTDEGTSLEIFRHFTEETSYPVLTHAISIILVGICIFGGIKWIEWANSVLVTLLMLIILITFGWALSMNYADIGIKFLFTANWKSLSSPTLWKDAFIQNAFDTGAGMGLFSAYSAYFRRKNGAVRYGTLLPIFNNCVSLICGISIFSTVFATLVSSRPTVTTTNIQQIMKDAGPGSTGLTFTWIPVLYSTMGVTGRILCSLFFLCLSFAGTTTLLSNLQLTTLTLKNCKVPHYIASGCALVATFLIGVPSALWIDVLNNQDSVWGFALLISGLAFAVLVIIYGVNKFRMKIVNEFGYKDFYLSHPWTFIIVLVVPVEGVLFILWWALEYLIGNPEWNSLGPTSFFVTIIEWLSLLFVLIIFTVVVTNCNLQIFQMDSPGGYDPYRLYEVEPYYPDAEFEITLDTKDDQNSEAFIHRL